MTRSFLKQITVVLTATLALSLAAAAQTSNKPRAAPSKPAASAPNSSSSEQLYSDTTFGFRYKIPYGWVDRTKDMNAPESDGQPKAAGSQGQVLLAVFERPPDAPGATVNSAVVIVSESASAYPGLKKAEDYLGPLTELATAKGLKSEGEPDVIEIDHRQLIRADFAKPLVPVSGSAKDAAQSDSELTMHQSTLVLLAKGQIVSFTFIAGSKDEIDDLSEGLHFTATKTSAGTRK